MIKKNECAMTNLLNYTLILIINSFAFESNLLELVFIATQWFLHKGTIFHLEQTSLINIRDNCTDYVLFSTLFVWIKYM
ncbi:hypothetical protein Ancab_009036 [Ancistrocladus abbreviatus]